MVDICGLVKIKMKVSKYAFYFSVLVCGVLVCPECLTAWVLCIRNVAIVSFLREMYIDLMLQLKKQPKRFFSEKKKHGHMHKFCMNRSVVCKRVTFGLRPSTSIYVLAVEQLCFLKSREWTDGGPLTQV